MKKTIRASKKRRGRPKTTGKGTLIAIRWQAAELKIIDDFASANSMSRGDALREIVRRLPSPK
jgi:hypothetical protein